MITAPNNRRKMVTVRLFSPSRKAPTISQVLTRFMDRLAWPSALAACITTLYVSLAENNYGPFTLYIVVMVVSNTFFSRRLIREETAASSRRVFLLVSSLAIMVACLMYQYYLGNNATPFPYGYSDDDYTFDTKALNSYKLDLMDIVGLKENIKSLGTGTWNSADYYSILLAFIYRGMDVIGFQPHPLFPRLVNAFFLACVAVMVLRVALLCGLNLGDARFSAYFCGLSPFMLFSAGHTYRDTIICFGVFACVYAIVRILSPAPVSQRALSNGNLPMVVLLAIGMAVASCLRQSYFFALLIMIAISILLSRAGRVLSLVIAGIVVCAAIITFPEIVSEKEQMTEAIISNLEYYHNRHADAAGNFTGVVFKMPYMVSIPFRLLLRNVSPLPLPQELLTEDFQRMGTIFWFFSIPFLVRSLVAAFRGTTWEQTRALRIVASSFIVFYLLNVISTLQDRHVVMYIPMAAILVGCHLVAAPRTMKADLLLMTFLAGCLALLWMARGALLA